MTKQFRAGGIAAALLFGFVHFAFVACGDDSSSSPTATPETLSETDAKGSDSSSSESNKELSSSSLSAQSSSQGESLLPEESSSSAESSSSKESSSSGHYAWQFLNPNLSYGEVEYNGIVYKTIEINGLTWFAENATTTEIYTKEITIENELKYGEYSYNADDRCPPDWHVASVDEFKTLTGELRGGDDWLCGEVSNESGFTALPGGMRNHMEWTFPNQGEAAAYFTSTYKEKLERDRNESHYCVTIDSTGEMSASFCDDWSNYYNVRCVKNPEGFDYYAVSVRAMNNNIPCDESVADKTMYKAMGMGKYVCRQDADYGEWVWEKED